jgi:hypothetical protein
MKVWREVFVQFFALKTAISKLDEAINQTYAYKVIAERNEREILKKKNKHLAIHMLSNTETMQVLNQFAGIVLNLAPNQSSRENSLIKECREYLTEYDRHIKGSSWKFHI